MNKIIKKIIHLYKWYFVWTEIQKTHYDLFTKGRGLMKDGKRINPDKFNLIGEEI